MIRREDGFTLVELMITMVVLVVVIVAVSQVFSGLLTQFKQQSKIAETNIEGIVGLEILRKDLEHAGYGIPQNITGVANWASLQAYCEADSLASTPNPANFNDGVASSTDPCPTSATGGSAPRAILTGNDADFSGANDVFDGSDYLVIKAVNVARNTAAERSTIVRVGNVLTEWDPSTERLANGSRVTVISPGTSDANRLALVVSSGAFFTTYNTATNPDSLTSAGFAPLDASEARFVYGLDADTNLRMPFNRADYWIHRETTNTATDAVPDRCAPNTGVLRKTVIAHANGTRSNPLPLLDCVADMQVVFGLDSDEDGDFQPGVTGSTDSYSEDISALTALQIRRRVKQVRVYILAHEGQRDPSYTHGSSTVDLGGDVGLGRVFNLATEIGTGWQNYRWKLYTTVARPNNLR